MDFQLPELGEGVYEAELVAWRVQTGEAVRPGQILMEVLTDKATMEVPAPFTGIVDSLKAEAGATVKVGDVVLVYSETGQSPNAAKPEQTAERESPSTQAAVLASVDGRDEANIHVKAAPSVRLLARKMGIALAGLQGSGPQGRILAEDVVQAARLNLPNVQASRPRYALDLGTPGSRIRMQGVRRKIADHMVHAKRTVPHYSYVDECDVSDLVRLREALRGPFEKAGARITYLAFFVKAVAGALKEVPLVNASLDEEAGEIVLHERRHIGVAVATPSGLMVPVIRDVDRKSLLEVAREVERLSSAARDGKVKLEDLRGGTFTVTSIGNIGGLISTPVINHPEVGILGIGKIVKRPVYDDRGEIRPADIVYLSFSFDHRVLDGAIGATFGNAVKQRLQNAAALVAGLDV